MHKFLNSQLLVVGVFVVVANLFIVVIFIVSASILNNTRREIMFDCLNTIGALSAG